MTFLHIHLSAYFFPGNTSSMKAANIHSSPHPWYYTWTVLIMVSEETEHSHHQAFVHAACSSLPPARPQVENPFLNISWMNPILQLKYPASLWP